MRWSLRTEPMYRLPSTVPTRDARVCCATERAAMMGSTTAKSLSASSCECSCHCLHTALRATSEKGLGGEAHNSVLHCVWMPLIVCEVWIHSDCYLENSGLMLSSSLRLCRFLRAGYREEAASRLPLHSSSTSAPLQENTEEGSQSSSSGDGQEEDSKGVSVT